MAPKKSFRKAYVGIVMDMALARSKISNRMVAQRLGVDETTIRRWRKENNEFERAFTEAREALREKINLTARKNLDVRKRKVVTKSGEEEKTTTEDVLPTHQDIAVFSKALGLGTSVYSEEERQRDVLREVMKHKVAGKYSALQAAQLLEAEGVKVPATLMMELDTPKKIEVLLAGQSTGKPETASLTPQEAAEQYKTFLG
ncbi:MAG: hypothetical protein ACRCZ6_20115 [Kluyvera sp.]|uniref:hypothetical protein n=1 Tax=Kluyvera sp. TaxID=1538228 RepID=UPI003F320EFB